MRIKIGKERASVMGWVRVMVLEPEALGYIILPVNFKQVTTSTLQFIHTFIFL